MKLSAKLVISFLLIISVLKCDSPVGITPYKDEPVVECLLLVGQGIEDFKFTRTLPVGSEYNEEKAGITDAIITITDESNNSTTLKPVGENPGLYADESFIIAPKTRYFLQIDYNGSLMTAQTVTPDTFTVSKTVDSSFVYLKDNIYFQWTKSEGAAAYYFTVTNLEPVAEKIDRDFSEENPYAKRKTRFFWTLGTTTVVFPWLHNYYGRHEIKIYAIDDNLYHYLQTSFQDIQELTEPESNIKNAIGYFASGVVSSRFYNLLKP